jgi:hypothetical protein
MRRTRRGLTSNQISEWEAYDRLDPIGTWREDFRLAYLSSLITNIALSIHGKKGTKMQSPMDFMIEWDPAKHEKATKVQTPEQMRDILMALASPKEEDVKRSKKEKS